MFVYGNHGDNKLHTEPATKRCLLKIALPKFLKYKERLLIILANSLKNTFEGVYF